MDKETAYNYLRSKFISSKKQKELIKKYNLKIRHGNLTKKEIQLVKDTLETFLNNRKLNLKDLEDHLTDFKEFPIKDLVFECTQACELRTFESIRTHIFFHYNPFVKMNICKEDEVRLVELVSEKGFAWKEIMHHLGRYKDYCRLKYLEIKGEVMGTLSKSAIENLLKNGLPLTETEWGVLCAKLKLTKAHILKKIKKYLNGKDLKNEELNLMDIRMIVLILKHNYYCKFNIDENQITEFLRSYNTVGSLSKEDEPTESDEIDDLRVGLKQTHNNIDNLRYVNFLKEYLYYFKENTKLDLNILICKDDIFWQNISRELDVESIVLKGAFNRISSIYEWKTFQDIYDTLMKLSYDYVLFNSKKMLIAQFPDN